MPSPLIEGLIAKLPVFDLNWSDHMKLAWFERFHELLVSASPAPPLAPEPAAAVRVLRDHVRRHRRAAQLARQRAKHGRHAAVSQGRLDDRRADEIEAAANLIISLARLPAESGAQGSEPSCDEGNLPPDTPKGFPHA
jgi:hypothetical protein